MIVIPGAHMLLQTRPAEAAAEIIHFTKSLAEAHMKLDGVPSRTIWLERDGWSVGILDQTLLPHSSCD